MKITGVQNNMSVIFIDTLENNFFHRKKRKSYKFETWRWVNDDRILDTE